MLHIYATVFLALALLFPLSSHAQHQAASGARPEGRLVRVETSRGDFTLLLYNDTPLHQQAFLDRVRNRDYEGVLLHRIIPQFMIQGGNLSTRGATAATDVGTDTLSVTIPAEIDPARHIHKRGALAAARIVGEENPERASSGSQFYIVTGTYYTDFDLDTFEAEQGRRYTPEQRSAYKLIGGAPWLDGEYTVFGEVVEGYKTIEKIERVATDSANRPKKDIIIKRMTPAD